MHERAKRLIEDEIEAMLEKVAGYEDIASSPQQTQNLNTLYGGAGTGGNARRRGLLETKIANLRQTLEALKGDF